ncbi:MULTISPECIES: DUF3078 domain-containing protein [Tenacibaculum]|uniref:DUF3078 domain-containing protein n=1 Tax=Tenacibaculum mesophilum TaxID=104268 RepID=A0ABM7CG75_9FLAO|nr:DUF3078 domain-containing protein [Tenacibaculum mesophilum]AZJ32788.1 DUF3078 domain-containing protein [Tenacibaculum mesophilum]KAF9658972.1 DUF3078 domain-containing protein [Tenacibaculum mesophilum]QFS28036.1 DUF3078 domain-containing protein [Tenacibaculum mesophilum]SHF74248.1 Protein of unknown function [Tenacibaculum mesophilum]
MKKLFLILISCYSFSLVSQETKKDSISTLGLQNSPLDTSFAFYIFNKRVFAEPLVKKNPPKKWTVTGKYTFLFNQSSFSNWAAGGNNTVAGNMTLGYDFNYKKKKWNWDNKIISAYGLSYIDGQGIRKTEDQFEYNSLLGFKTSKLWFLSFFSNFKTQYTKGYDYKQEPKVAVSDFFSPAYWSFGPGMLWKRNDDARINIAPATARYTFVSDEFSGKYGVDEGKNTSFSLGFNLSAYFKSEIMEDVTMESIVAVYSDYLNKPQNIDIDYQLNFFVKINKNLSTNLSLHTIIDDDASSRVQFKEVFGLGLNYIFHKT